jgi:hypothetical protein
VQGASPQQPNDVTVTLTGTNFTQGSNVVITPSTGITQYGATFSATSITTHFVIASNAPTTARTVTVGTSGGTTAGVTFTVVTKPPAPTLTSITPNTGTRGNTVVGVHLVGTNFSSAGLGVTLNGSGVTATNVQYQSATLVTADFVVDSGATLGNHRVTVTTAGGTTTAVVNFNVTNPPKPTLTSITPISGTRGTTVTVTFTGTNFATNVPTGGSAINISGAGNTVATRITPTITSATSTQLVVSIVIGSAAATGSHFVSVTTPGNNNTTAAQTFTVN